MCRIIEWGTWSVPTDYVVDGEILVELDVASVWRDKQEVPPEVL